MSVDKNLARKNEMPLNFILEVEVLMYGE